MQKQLIAITCMTALVAVLANCTKKDAQNLNVASFGSLPALALSPADNVQTSDKINLGKLLFWDPVLSGGRDVACASCHHPSMGYTDHLDLGIGTNGKGIGALRHFVLPNDIPFAKRNTSTIINVAFNGMDKEGNYDPVKAVMFYDNRVSGLELQSLEPMKTMEEMMGRKLSASCVLDTIVGRLKAIPAYVQLFTYVFGDNSVTISNTAKAIASFERTIIANNSPYDKYIRGDASAMTSTQIQGMQAFQDNGCSNCHSGAMFSDYKLHVLSAPDNSKLPTDAGANGSYAFRTPSLRNLSLTAPYMHSGVFNSLDQVLDFYDRVGDHRSQNGHVSNSQLDAQLQRINQRDKNAIIQFLNALNDTDFDKTIPASVPSHLPVGGNL